MADIVEQLTPIIAGGGIGVVSLLIGRRTDRASSHTEWLRNERKEAYLEVLHAHHLMWRAMLNYIPDATSENRAIAYDSVHNLVRISHAVDVLGPTAVTEAVDALLEAHKELFDASLDPVKRTEMAAAGRLNSAESIAVTAKAAALQKTIRKTLNSE